MFNRIKIFFLRIRGYYLYDFRIRKTKAIATILIPMCKEPHRLFTATEIYNWANKDNLRKKPYFGLSKSDYTKVLHDYRIFDSRIPHDGSEPSYRLCQGIIVQPIIDAVIPSIESES